MAVKIPQWVWLAGVAGVGYIIYKSFDKFRQGANYVVDAAASAIAAPIIGVQNLLHETPQVTGSAVFPNGAQVPVKNLQVKASGSGTNFRALVTYQGRTYALSPHDANGNYPAVPI